MGLRVNSILLLATLCVILTGCADVLSEGAEDNKTPEGIPYFLPRRPFVVTVSMPAGTSDAVNATVTVVGGPAEPDPSRRYFLSQGLNWLAKNEFNISVAQNGLLKNTTSTATSEVATFASNAASSAAAIVGMGTGLPTSPIRSLFRTETTNLTDDQPPQALPAPDDKAVNCPPAGMSFQYLIYPEVTNSPHRFCGHFIDVALGTAYSSLTSINLGKRATPKSGEKPNTRGPTPDPDPDQRSGIYFRHELPYLVTVRYTQAPEDYPTFQTVLTSPDESETNYFPIKRSFFANNTANIAVADGEITAVDQTTEGEAPAAAALPATVIGSYTNALGQMFASLTTVSADKQKYAQQLQQTAATQVMGIAVAQAQTQLCLKTVSGYDFTTLNQAQAAAAAAAIKAACTSSTGTSAGSGGSTTTSTGN